MLIGSVCLLMASGAAGVPAAAAAAGPTPPARSHSTITASLTAREPFGDYVTRLSFDVTSIDPALVTVSGPATMTVTGTMTNTGPEPLTDLSYRFQRGKALRTEADVRQELSQPSEPVEQVQNEFTQMSTNLAAGAAAPFVFTAAITDASGLNVASPGVYPLMVNVNGAVGLTAGPLEARIGELHLLLTVIGVPAGSGTAGSGTAGSGTAAPSTGGSGTAGSGTAGSGTAGSGTAGSGTNGSSTPQPPAGGVTARSLPVNFVWPLVDRPHLGVGGVFLDDDLQAAISPGGRLATLLDGLTDAAASRLPPGSVTVVIDPQLLDELDRMTGNYRVVAAPGDPQPPMTALLQAAASAAATASAASPVPTTPQTNATTAATPAGTAAAGTPSPGQPAGTPAGPATVNTAAANTAAANTAADNTAAGTAAGQPTPATPDLGSADIAGTTIGTGQSAATSYLGRLRQVAAHYPVVVLPYGDPDVVALVRAGLSGQVTTAVNLGREVATRVLGVTTTPAGGAPGISGQVGTAQTNPAPNNTAQINTAQINTSTAYPINGAADGETLAALRVDGLTTALLSETSVDLAGSSVGAATVDLPDGGGPMAAAIAQPDVLSGFGALIDQGKQSGWAKRVNALTGVMAQQSLDGTATPAVFMPDRRWSPDAPGLLVLSDLLGTLGSNQVISGVSLADLAAGASQSASPAYPQQARNQELEADYLDRISRSRAEVASIRQTLAATPQRTDPNLVLAPLDVALDDAASTAFRTDPSVGEANLATVEATTQSLRTGVEISSAGNSYTLASSSSPLVLTVQNNLTYDVPVRVQITGGERVGLTVSDPEIQVVPAGRSQQVKIPAEVSRSGQFQVSAQLVGEDGALWGPPVQLSVDSTAYGGLTVIIIVVAGGVLVLMVALRIVQRVRARRAAGTAGDRDGDSTDGGPDHQDDHLDPVTRSEQHPDTGPSSTGQVPTELPTTGQATTRPPSSTELISTDRALRDVIARPGPSSSSASASSPTATAGRHSTLSPPVIPADQVRTDRS